jgi:hypothetical protein
LRGLQDVVRRGIHQLDKIGAGRQRGVGFEQPLVERRLCRQRLCALHARESRRRRRDQSREQEAERQSPGDRQIQQQGATPRSYIIHPLLCPVAAAIWRATKGWNRRPAVLQRAAFQAHSSHRGDLILLRRHRLHWYVLPSNRDPGARAVNAGPSVFASLMFAIGM